MGQKIQTVSALPAFMMLAGWRAGGLAGWREDPEEWAAPRPLTEPTPLHP